MSCQTQIDAADAASAITCPDWLARQPHNCQHVLRQVIDLLSDGIAVASDNGDTTTLNRLQPVLTKAIAQTLNGTTRGRRSLRPVDDDDAIRSTITNAERRVELARLTAQYGNDGDWRVDYQIKGNGGVYAGVRHRRTRRYLYLGTVISAKKSKG